MSFVKKIILVLISALGLILFLFSTVPYLIRPAALEGDRHALADADSKFATVQGTELHYRLYNEYGSRGNVLLIHGFGGSTFSWRSTAPDLAASGFRVVAVDLPGFGLSERRTGIDHTQEGRAELIWSLLDQLANDEPWHLVGHSMGGGTAAAMTLAQPQRVKTQVYAAGAIDPDTSAIPDLLLRYPPLQRWFQVLAGRIMLKESAVERMVSSAYGRTATPEELEGYFLPITVADSDAVLFELQKHRQSIPLEELKQVNMPVLCIWGELDSWVPLEKGKMLAETLPNASLAIIPNEGHCPMETAPETFNQILLEFYK